MRVIIDAKAGTLKIPDTGVTMRTLLACAAKGYETRPLRIWQVIYGDGNVTIGSVRIKNDHLRKGKPNVNDAKAGE